MMKNPSHPVKTRLTTFYNEIRTDTYLFLVSLLIVSWGVLDLTSTYIALIAHGSIAYEANPLVRSVMRIHPSLFIPYKTLAMLAIFGICVKGRNHITAVTRWEWFFKALIIGGVVVTTLNLYAAHLATAFILI